MIATNHHNFNLIAFGKHKGCDSREARDGEDTPHKRERILRPAAPEQVAKDIRKRLKVKLDLVD